jgi:hypothetical protein
MSDEAIEWGDWGGEESAAATLLKPGDYTGKITVAMWGKADWAERKFPESGGRLLKAKVVIDAPEGYAEAWVDVPVVKALRWRVKRICEAAGVVGPSEDGPAWSPACLVGRRVSIATSVYTNERTGESKVQIDKWYPGEDPAPPADEKPKAKVSKNAKSHGGDDDIPF